MEISTLARLGAAAVSISLSDVVSLVTAKASQKANEFGNRDMAVLVRAMAMAGQGAAAEALVNGAAPRGARIGCTACATRMGIGQGALAKSCFGHCAGGGCRSCRPASTTSHVKPSLVDGILAQ